MISKMRWIMEKSNNTKDKNMTPIADRAVIKMNLMSRRSLAVVAIKSGTHMTRQCFLGILCVIIYVFYMEHILNCLLQKKKSKLNFFKFLF